MGKPLMEMGRSKNKAGKGGNMPLRLVKERELTEEEKKLFEQGDKDFEWLATHSSEIWEKYKGKYITVVHEELFVGESEADVQAQIQRKYAGKKANIWKIPYKRELWIL